MNTITNNMQSGPVIPLEIEASSNKTLDNIQPKPSPAPRIASAAGGIQTRDPRHATGLVRSVLFAIAGFCAGVASGVAITMLVWSGLKDRFNSGVETTASGNANATGDINADGNFDANGEAAIDDVEGNVLGWDFGVPASGEADFDAQGNLDFDGAFQSDAMALDFDGEAAVDLGAAPVKVVMAVGLVFGIVVGTVAWLAERQLTAGQDRAALLEITQNIQNTLNTQGAQNMNANTQNTQDVIRQASNSGQFVA